MVVRPCLTEYYGRGTTAGSNERPNVSVVVIVDIVVAILMHMVDNLEVAALVSDEMSNFGRAKPSKTRHGDKCLRVTSGERVNGVPLIEILKNVGPCLSCVVVVVRQSLHVWSLNGPI
jgi:hypothetical protein